MSSLHLQTFQHFPGVFTTEMPNRDVHEAGLSSTMLKMRKELNAQN